MSMEKDEEMKMGRREKKTCRWKERENWRLVGGDMKMKMETGERQKTNKFRVSSIVRVF